MFLNLILNVQLSFPLTLSFQLLKELQVRIHLLSTDANSEHILTGSPMDYIGFSMTLPFDTCETRHCVNVSIVNDMVDEPDEVFDYIIGPPPAGLDLRITIRPDMGEIFIIDEDGNVKVLCCVELFQFSPYTIPQ